MKQTWITADWHLGEDRFKIMPRPFKTSEEMFEVLLENHNKLVNSEDDVIIVGDVCYQKKARMVTPRQTFQRKKP